MTHNHPQMEAVLSHLTLKGWKCQDQIALNSESHLSPKRDDVIIISLVAGQIETPIENCQSPSHSHTH